MSPPDVHPRLPPDGTQITADEWRMIQEYRAKRATEEPTPAEVFEARLENAYQRVSDVARLLAELHEQFKEAHAAQPSRLDEQGSSGG